MILVAGEALIDLVADEAVLHPLPGGGPFNTAVALGQLGARVGYLGRLSDDRFGRTLEQRLADAGVELRYTLRGPAPTPLAVVHTAQNGDAEYSFYLIGTAYSDLAHGDLPQLGPEISALHLGTLALATDPPAGALETLIQRESTARLIAIDPNVRPAVCGDRDVYRDRFERWTRLADLVKVSSADADWLYPGAGPDEVVEHIRGLGPALVLFTLGAQGAIARTGTRAAQVTSLAVDVVDTIGAGDAFSAGALHWLQRAGKLDAEAVGALHDAELAAMLGFATAVAALQCTRAGASPPTRDDVQALLRKRDQALPAAHE